MMINIDYASINSRALNMLLSVEKHVSLIDKNLKLLVELRVSQINGCAYCLDLHAHEARQAGEQQQRLDCLSAWRESQLFAPREQAALSWAESVTLIASHNEVNRQLPALLEEFSESEVVDLTYIIAVMNSLNRLAISFGDKPAERGE